jgi:hypothetical protein
VRRAAPLALALVLLAGCGQERSTSGKASLWITRDRGKTVVLTQTVPAGLTAMEALDREADIETRYGGRFVQSIEGLAGDRSRRRDWFWFLNGIEADRSAADYRLRPGDVEWWDLRSWGSRMREPVVVGAFPEPFRHGYDGKVLETVVRYPAGMEKGARAIGRLLGATSVEELKQFAAPPPENANIFSLANGPEIFIASLRDSQKGAGSAVQFTFAGDAEALVRNPGKYRFRYHVP